MATELNSVDSKRSSNDSMSMPPPPAYAENFTYENDGMEVEIKSSKMKIPASRKLYDNIEVSSNSSSDGVPSSSSSSISKGHNNDAFKSVDLKDVDLEVGDVLGDLKRAALDEELEADKVTPVRLTWDEVDVIASPKTDIFGRRITEEKAIIKGVTGYAEPGTSMAVMGSSGAGKSTLLNVLTWRHMAGLKINGKIMCNGVELGSDISAISAFCQQDDLFMGELTVKEHLTFTARLRLGDNYTEEEKSRRVKLVMKKCSLTKCETVQIGVPGMTKTISGGEKKRLSVAAELLENPSILFLDEPTSGLDSYLAEVIVKLMRDVTRSNCSVLCTIHQPSSEVFELFDRVLLLSMGEVFFHGSTKDAIKYFNEIGRPVPVNYNPADHYINELSVIPGAEVESKAILAKRFVQFKESNYFSDISSKIKETVNDTQAAADYKKEVLGGKKRMTRYRVGTLKQFQAVQIRAFKSVFRNPMMARVKPIQLCISAVLVGLIYLRVPFGKPYLSHEVSSVSGGLFLVITNTSLTIGFSVLNAFPSEINLFRREHFNGMYSVAVYFIAKNLAELPMFIFLGTLYTIIIYFMFGLYPNPQQFFIFYAIVLLIINTSVSFYYMISAWAPSPLAAITIGPAALLPLLLLGGFFVAPSQVPCFIYWIRYLSWFYYAFQLLAKNQYRKIDYFGCPDFFPEGIPNKTYPGGVNAQGSLYYYKNETDPDCIYKDGITYLRSLKIFTQDEGMWWGLFITLLVVYRIFAWMILAYKVRDSTR